jgi:hypothetical protein
LKSRIISNPIINQEQTNGNNEYKRRGKTAGGTTPGKLYLG